MIEFEPSQNAFDGVSLTPNVFTRAYGVVRQVGFFALRWWFARCGGDWSAQPDDGEPENVVYFH